MPNPIKYTTGSESDALVKGNFRIGTGSVGKGPSDTTGFYQGPNVPSGGYVIYMNRDGAPGNLSYHSAANDSELISFTNSLAGQSYTTAQQCFDYYYGQTDKVLVNQDYPADYPYIVMDGLVFNLDAGITQSYPGSGTVWTDINGLGPKNNGTLINGPTFNSANGGSIVFDGADDYVNVTDNISLDLSEEITVEFVFKIDSSPPGYAYHITVKGTSASDMNFCDYILKDYGGVRLQFWANAGGSWKSVSKYTQELTTNQWYHVIWSYNYLDSGIIKLNNITQTNGSSGTGVLINNNEPFQIGYRMRNDHNYLNGNVALVRIYNRALTTTEMTQNFNATKGRFGL